MAACKPLLCTALKMDGLSIWGVCLLNSRRGAKNNNNIEYNLLEGVHNIIQWLTMEVEGWMDGWCKDGGRFDCA